MNLYEQHQLNDQTKTVVLRRCWSLIFDVNGNAPNDAVVASFATEELAKQALKLWGGMKDKGQHFSVVVNGTKFSEPPQYAVEGYNFDTYYRVDLDWQEDDKIFTCLAQIHTLCDSEENTDQPDGIYFEAKRDGSDEGDEE